MSKDRVKNRSVQVIAGGDVKYTQNRTETIDPNNPVNNKHSHLIVITGEKQEELWPPVYVSHDSPVKTAIESDDPNQTVEDVKAKRISELEAAVNILLEKYQDQKKDFEEKIMANTMEMILPYLEKLNHTGLNAEQKFLVDILESNIKEVVSPFSQKLSSRYIGLTPSEIMVANMVKLGHTTKEIADRMNLSYKTIQSYRENIRRKFKIKNKKINLRSFLLDRF